MNEITYKRMLRTMVELSKSTADSLNHLSAVLLGLQPPLPLCEPNISVVGKIDSALNQSQKDAVIFALASLDLALIHGPPGVYLIVYVIMI